MSDLHRTDTPSTSTGAVKPSVSEQARAKSDQIAVGAQDKTAATVNNAENRLENFKGDLLAGNQRHSSQTQNSAAQGSEQGAFLRTVGIPQEAGTASDSPGAANTNMAPNTSTAGISGAPVPGVTRTPPSGLVSQEEDLSGTRKAAFNAADKAQEALSGATSKLFGGPKA